MQFRNNIKHTFERVLYKVNVLHMYTLTIPKVVVSMVCVNLIFSDANVMNYIGPIEI